MQLLQHGCSAVLRAASLPFDHGLQHAAATVGRCCGPCGAWAGGWQARPARLPGTYQCLKASGSMCQWQGNTWGSTYAYSRAMWAWVISTLLQLTGGQVIESARHYSTASKGFIGCYDSSCRCSCMTALYFKVGSHLQCQSVQVMQTGRPRQPTPIPMLCHSD